MARLLAETGRAAFFLARSSDEVIALCQQASEMAERQGELEAQAEASITIALASPDTDKDTDKLIQALQEAAEFSEANRLWAQARRAYANLAANFLQPDNAIQYVMRCLDISIHVGNIEWLFWDLKQLVAILISRGEIKTIEATLRDILSSSTTPQSRVDEFVEEVHSSLFFARGELIQALEFIRCGQQKSRKTANYNQIANWNIGLENICRDLKLFKGMDYLSEAETCLQENIRLNVFPIESRLRLVENLALQKRFTEAHEQLDEAIKNLDQPISRFIVVTRLLVEAVLASAEGRWEEAVSKRLARLDMCQADGNRNAWAWNLIPLGDDLLSRNAPGDREQAQQIYHQSLEMFTEMGATGYIQVLEARLRGL
jgi:tetratricopeptide (TPR) repeat protein